MKASSRAMFSFFLRIYSIILVLGTAQATKTDPKWAQKMLDVFQARDSVSKKLTTLGSDITTQEIEDLISILLDFPSQLKGLDNLDISQLEQNNELVKDLMNQPEVPIVAKQFHSENLESHYSNRGLGFLLKTFKGYHSSRCIKALYSPPKPFKGFDLPLASMCSTIKEDLSQNEKYTYSTDKICTSVNKCTGKQTPYPYGDSKGTSMADACTEEKSKCDVVKALPLMGALLWYKASAFIAQSLCYNSLKQPDTSLLKQKHSDLESMTKLIIAYASTVHWDDFFTKAVRQRAYSDLQLAMSLVKERSQSTEFVSLACEKLEATDLCTVGDIFKAYQSLRGLKKSRNMQRRDLHIDSNVDHREMVKLRLDDIKYTRLLGNIRSLDENLRKSITGISNYFYGLAKYDQDLAVADVAFIQGKLTEFEKKSLSVSTKLESDIKAAMKAMMASVIAQLGEETILLGLRIAENLNIIKAIFGGVDTADIYEQAAEVARAAAELTHGTALVFALSEVLKDMGKLGDQFNDNANQISGLLKMMDAIKKNQLEEIDKDANKFIKAYGDYTPKVDRARLAKNDALWSTFKDSTCDLLMNAQGIGASVTKGVAGGMLLCERLEGTLAEFSTLRENIFDFQFDLVDALARVVRGNFAKRLSKSITVSNDLLEASKLMLGYFMVQYRLQSESFLYCDKLTYRSQGQVIRACNIQSEYFSLEDIKNVIGYTSTGRVDRDVRFVYIPTKPQFPGDTGVINLQSLAKGNDVIFEIPRNRTWLRRFNWLARGETLAPFVESFKLYLPLKSYGKVKRKERYLKTRIKLYPRSGSFLSDNSDVIYNLPPETSNYFTTYEEGYHPSRCPVGKEIPNPYSLCGNLPNICDTLSRDPGSSLMPTILTTWKLSYKISNADKDLKWNAPDPATDLLIIGKIRVQTPAKPAGSKRSMRYKRNGEVVIGCCKGNTYRPKWNDKTCIPCPSSPSASVKKIGGYYCRKGNEKVAGEPPAI